MNALDISKTHLHWGACKQDGKEYRSYSLARSFRKNGKVHKEIILKLGKLSDKDVLHWKMLLKSLKGNSPDLVPIQDIVTEAQYQYLAIAVLLETWHSWGLEQLFKDTSNRDVPLWKVVATLVINRCIDPCSKSQVPTWFQNTALPYLLKVNPDQMNPSRIFRELSTIEKLKPQIGDYIYSEVAKRDPDSMTSVFYDLSSSTFSGTHCVLMNWGFCKEGFENHIVLALVVNKKGLPLYWNVLQGSTADATTIELLMCNLKERFNPTTTTMVFDRGMVSEDNLSMLEHGNIKYISAMDRNQIKGLTDFNFTTIETFTTEEMEQSLLASGGFCKMNAITYYREAKPQNGARRYILCFNPQLRNDQLAARRNAIDRFQVSVREINQELLQAQKNRNEQSSRKKFENAMSIEQKSYLSIKLKKKKLEHENEQGCTVTTITYQGSIEVDERKLCASGLLDGFWMIVTNQIDKNTEGQYQMSSGDVLSAYRDKVIIESAFRDIKSFLDISPIHVWTMDHVKAHYTICVLAYLLDRTLTLRLHEDLGEESSEIITHVKLYEVLGKCMLNRIGIDGTKQEVMGLTRPSDIQVDLLKRLDRKYLIENDFWKSEAMK